MQTLLVVLFIGVSVFYLSKYFMKSLPNNKKKDDCCGCGDKHDS